MESERIVGIYKVNRTKSIAVVKNYPSNSSMDKEILSKNFVEYYCSEKKNCLTKYVVAEKELLEYMENWTILTEEEVKKLDLDYNSVPPEGYTNFSVKENGIVNAYFSLINKCESELRHRNFTTLAELIGFDNL